MHTFYQRIDPKHHHEGTTFNMGTGMSSDERHMALVSTWEDLWQDAGFETRVLDISDAMRHPNYAEIRNFLDHEAFGEYDELCFIRWFAMATVGGGWMSDYDVAPIASLVPDAYFAPSKRLHKKYIDANNGIPLPHRGKFTIYDSDGRVPSLMSGSAKEWDRLASALLDLAHGHIDDFYSDMYAIIDYSKANPKAFKKENQVVTSLADIITTEGNIDCAKVWNSKKTHLWVVHFSHYNIGHSVEVGVLEKGLGGDDRPEIERDFVQNWKEQCSERFKDSA